MSDPYWEELNLHRTRDAVLGEKKCELELWVWVVAGLGGRLREASLRTLEYGTRTFRPQKPRSRSRNRTEPIGAGAKT